MKINSITLNNIRSYLEETIYFGEGVNFISGSNGAGKTTIVESIGYAIFDAKPDAGKNVTQYDYFVRYGCTSGKITVDIEDNKGEKYIVERKINKKTTSWTVYEKESGMELNLHGADDVKEFIKEHIGADKNQKLEDMFTDIIGVAQGSFTVPFMFATADRVKHFNTILNVLEYRKAADNGRETMKYYNELITGSEKEVAVLSERLSSKEQIEKDNVTLKEQLLECKKELEISSQNKQKQKEFVDKLNELKNKLIETEKHIKSIEAQSLAKDEAINAQKQNLDNAINAKNIVLEYKGAYDAYTEAQKNAQILEKKKEQREQITRAKIEIENKYSLLCAEANNKIAVYKSKIENASEQIIKAENEINQINNKLSALINFSSINENEKLIASAEEEVKNYYERLSEVEKITQRIQSGLEKWRVNEQQIQKTSEELQNGKDVLHKSEVYEDAIREKEIIAVEIGILGSNIALQNGHLNEIAKGVCPVCHSDCTDIPRLKNEITDYLKKIEIGKSELIIKQAFLESKIQENKSSYEAAVTLKEKEVQLKEYLLEKEKYAGAFDMLFKKIKETGIEKAYEAAQDKLLGVSKALGLSGSISAISSIETDTKDPESFAQQADEFMLSCRNIHKGMAEIVSGAKGHINNAINNAKDQKQEYEEAVRKQNKITAEAQNEISFLNDSINKGYAFLDQKKKEYDINIESMINRLKEYEEVGDLLENNRLILEKNLKQYEIYMNNLNIASKEKDIEAALQKLSEEKIAIKKETMIEEAKLSALSQQFNEDMLNKASADYAISIENAAKSSSAFEQKKSELEKNEFELKRLSQQQAVLDSTKQTLVIQNKGKAFARIIFEDVLKNAGERIGGIYRQRLSSKANDLFKEMTNENVELIWEDDYNVVILDYYAGEKRQRVFRQLSGGEQMAAALSIRLSFISALTNARIAFFDEPTTNLDSQRRDNLAALLPKVVNDFTQVFVISHDDTFDSVTQNLIKLQKTREGTKNS